MRILGFPMNYLFFNKEDLWSELWIVFRKNKQTNENENLMLFYVTVVCS